MYMYSTSCAPYLDCSPLFEEDKDKDHSQGDHHNQEQHYHNWHCYGHSSVVTTGNWNWE